MTARHDVAVVGGGPAGAAFAVELARAGRDVVLVERESGPHDKVCGEFLSGEALGYLAALGVDVGALGAVPVEIVRVSHGSVSAQRALPFRAASLSRRRLDEALLARAAGAGVAVLRNSAVRDLRQVLGGWCVRLENGTELIANEAALATGKHDLRGRRRPPGRQNDLIGLKAHFRLRASATAELARAVEIGLFQGGYAGLELVEDGIANLCLVVGTETFAGHGREWASLLAAVMAAAPRLGELLKGASPRHERPLAVARIPYGLVRPDAEDGLWRLGDQAAVIPSFAGEGMSIALHSARLAALTMLGGADSQAFQRRLAADVTRQVGLATLLSQALVLSVAQTAGAAVARVFPATLAAVAAATRIRPSAILLQAD